MQKYTKQLLHLAAENGFWLRILGEVGNWPIWLIRTQGHPKRDTIKLLIAAGFHGEEKAGPWAIIEWMKNYDAKLLKKFDISFLPVVNPTAFNRGARYNTWGEKSNCGFCHPELKDKPSEEGKILIENINFLLPLAKDGFLSLHEDITTKEYYAYTFEPTKEPGAFTCGLLSTLGEFFDKPLNGVGALADANAGNGRPYVVNGLVYKLCDGSFEDWLFHKGVQKVAVTETPALHKLQRRIDANVAIINKFIELCKDR